MYNIEIDIPSNILIMHLKGNFDNRQGQLLYEELREKIKPLKREFQLFTDLSQLEQMSFDAHESIDDIMDLCNDYGVAKVVRLITNENSDIGFNIMSLFHFSHSVIIHTCKTLEEAECALKIQLKNKIHA